MTITLTLSGALTPSDREEALKLVDAFAWDLLAALATATEIKIATSFQQTACRTTARGRR